MLNLLYRHGATQNNGDYAQSGNIAMVAELLGEHPEKVLEALGYSRDEQIALFRAGVTS